jgi:purine catabolism regulator
MNVTTTTVGLTRSFAGLTDSDDDQGLGLRPRRPRRNAGHSPTMAVCDKVAAAAARGADAAELTRVFAQASGKTVMLLDPDFRLQAQGEGGIAGGTPSWDPGDASSVRLLHELANERRTLRAVLSPGAATAWECLAAPIMAGDTMLGYLLMAGEPTGATDEVDLIVANYTAALFAVALASSRTGRELGQRYQEAVMDSLLSGHFLDTQDATRKARILGVTDSGPYRVAVVRVSRASVPPRSRSDEVGEEADGPLARLSGRVSVPALVRGSELVMLLPGQEAAPDGARDDTADARRCDPVPVPSFQQLCDTPLTCGVSEVMRLPEHAPRAFTQAQHAIDLGIRIGRAGQTICHEELGIYRLLLQIGDMNQLVQYAEDVLGPVIDYDARRKSDLLGTLSVYLNQRESPKQSARVLRVHVNTVLYRIQRIESLTSLDLANPDDLLSAHVATKIIESQRASLQR